MQYLTSHVFLGRLSYTFLTEEVSFMHSVTSSFSPKTAFRPFVQFQLFCMFCKLSMAKGNQAQCYWRGRHEQLQHYHCCLASLFQPSITLAQQKSLTVRIKRAETHKYKHAKKDK